MLQDKLDIMNCIIDLLTKSETATMFYFDKSSGKQRLSESRIGKVKQFNQLKELVSNCSDKSQMVDTELLTSLAD